MAKKKSKSKSTADQADEAGAEQGQPIENDAMDAESAHVAPQVDSDVEDDVEGSSSESEENAPLAADLVAVAAGTKKDVHNLSDCLIDSGKIDNNLWKQTQVRILTLSGLAGPVLPPKIGVLVNLIELNLSNGKLQRLPRAMRLLVNLRALDVDDNELERMPTAVFGLPRLETLSACRNKISRLGLLPPPLPTVEEMTATQQRAHARGEDVFGPCTISVLKLDGNLINADELERVTDFERLPRLRVLSLAQNLLDTVPASISAAVGLQELYLAGNPLVRLPASLAAFIGGGGGGAGKGKGKGSSAHGVGGGKLKSMTLTVESFKDTKAAKTWEQNGGNAGGGKSVQALLKYLERWVSREAQHQKAEADKRRQQAAEAIRKANDEAADAVQASLTPEQIEQQRLEEEERRAARKAEREQLEREMQERQEANRQQLEAQQAAASVTRAKKNERKATRAASLFPEDLTDFMDDAERVEYERKRAALILEEEKRLAAEEEERQKRFEQQAEQNRKRLEAEAARKQAAKDREDSDTVARAGRNKKAGKKVGVDQLKRASAGSPAAAAANSDAKVFVGGLPAGVEPSMVAPSVRIELESFGKIVDLYVPKDRETGMNRGFAFVTFSQATEAAAAVDGSKKYRVKWANAR